MQYSPPLQYCKLRKCVFISNSDETMATLMKTCEENGPNGNRYHLLVASPFVPGITIWNKNVYLDRTYVIFIDPLRIYLLTNYKS